eukprot:scaffold13729_cov105-Isochrysis_galbana.AAC.4
MHQPSARLQPVVGSSCCTSKMSPKAKESSPWAMASKSDRATPRHQPPPTRCPASAALTGHPTPASRAILDTAVVTPDVGERFTTARREAAVRPISGSVRRARSDIHQRSGSRSRSMPSRVATSIREWRRRCKAMARVLRRRGRGGRGAPRRAGAGRAADCTTSRCTVPFPARPGVSARGVVPRGYRQCLSG